VNPQSATARELDSYGDEARRRGEELVERFEETLEGFLHAIRDALVVPLALVVHRFTVRSLMPRVNTCRRNPDPSPLAIPCVAPRALPSVGSFS